MISLWMRCNRHIQQETGQWVCPLEDEAAEGENLRATPHKTESTGGRGQNQPEAWRMPSKGGCGQSKSSRQAGPVSQDQICQRKHKIQFGGLFMQTSVSSFPAMEPALDHSEDMLNLGSDGGLFPLAALDLPFGTSRSVF